MQYYPSGLPWAETAGASEQPWKYNGKEFVEIQLNIDRLNLCTSTSHNMNALKALTKSEVTYNFLVQDKSSNGQTDMKIAGGVLKCMAQKVILPLTPC